MVSCTAVFVDYIIEWWWVFSWISPWNTNVSPFFLRILAPTSPFFLQLSLPLSICSHTVENTKRTISCNICTRFNTIHFRSKLSSGKGHESFATTMAENGVKMQEEAIQACAKRLRPQFLIYQHAVERWSRKRCKVRLWRRELERMSVWVLLEPSEGTERRMAFAL